MSVNRDEKIEYARRYAAELVEQHPGIAGIVLGGSVARGNDLPISDVDLWCFVDERDHPLPVRKHSAGELYVDIEQRPASELTQSNTIEDSYFCGYIHDAMILYDRDGNVGRCQVRSIEAIRSPHLRKKQLASILESVERNARALAASAEARGAREACRSAIFAAWSLCDYMLTARGISPGGSRGIARLTVAWPEAADALMDFEGFVLMDHSHFDGLNRIYRSVANTGSFFATWLEKVEWMFANGYTPDALHALWIAFGLRIKDAPEDLNEQLDLASSQWLETIGWDWNTVQAKSHQLRELSDNFCRRQSNLNSLNTG